jgi:hypothetical protein
MPALTDSLWRIPPTTTRGEESPRALLGLLNVCFSQTGRQFQRGASLRQACVKSHNFLKQTAGLLCIASDMRMIFVRTMPREAFKKVQLLPELTTKSGVGVAAARPLVQRLGGLMNSPESRSAVGADARTTAFRVNEGTAQA